MSRKTDSQKAAKDIDQESGRQRERERERERERCLENENIIIRVDEGYFQASPYKSQ